MKRVSIIGMGLMGGSLGLALKRRGLAEVHVFARRQETRELALAMGAADEAFDQPGATLRGADVAVFCLPICSIPEVARECAADFEAGCVVTDVGSTKTQLVASMHDVFRSGRVSFVGSHPMAGSEKNGMEAARADLYQGAVVAVTPDGGTPLEAVQTVAGLWSGVGARVVRSCPAVHDALVARTSHLPHLAAALLVNTSGRDGLPELKPFCGPGFRDTTRIASGAPDIWHDIVKTNHASILGELREFESRVKSLVSLVEAGDYDAVRLLLEDAKRRRDELVS